MAGSKPDPVTVRVAPAGFSPLVRLTEMRGATGAGVGVGVGRGLVAVGLGVGRGLVGRGLVGRGLVAVGCRAPERVGAAVAEPGPEDPALDDSGAEGLGEADPAAALELVDGDSSTEGAPGVPGAAVLVAPGVDVLGVVVPDAPRDPVSAAAPHAARRPAASRAVSGPAIRREGVRAGLGPGVVVERLIDVLR
jgi:hypothetical protein